MSEIYTDTRSLAAGAKASTVAPSVTKVGSPVKDLASDLQAKKAPKNNVKDENDNTVSLNLVKAAKTQSETLEMVAEVVESYIPDAKDNTKLSIAKDEITGQFIYRALDRKSGEIVHQFPSDEILRVIHAKRKVEGLVIDNKA